MKKIIASVLTAATLLSLSCTSAGALKETINGVSYEVVSAGITINDSNEYVKDFRKEFDIEYNGQVVGKYYAIYTKSTNKAHTRSNVVGASNYVDAGIYSGGVSDWSDKVKGKDAVSGKLTVKNNLARFMAFAYIK